MVKWRKLFRIDPRIDRHHTDKNVDFLSRPKQSTRNGESLSRSFRLRNTATEVGAFVECQSGAAGFICACLVILQKFWSKQASLSFWLAYFRIHYLITFVASLLNFYRDRSNRSWTDWCGVGQLNWTRGHALLSDSARFGAFSHTFTCGAVDVPSRPSSIAGALGSWTECGSLRTIRTYCSAMVIFFMSPSPLGVIRSWTLFIVRIKLDRIVASRRLQAPSVTLSSCSGGESSSSLRF